MNSLNKLEKEIIETALIGSGVVLRRLLDQTQLLQVVSREFTGVGFFTKILQLDRLTIVPVEDFEISDVEGKAATLEYGFGCVLFIRQGQVRTVECFTYDEPWPGLLGSFKLFVTGNAERNYDRFLV